MRPGLPIRINNIFVHLNDCFGAPQYTTDSLPVFWFPGREASTAAVNSTFRGIAAIATECYNKAAENVVNGGELVLNFGCGYTYPEFDSLFIRGRSREYDIAGNILSSLSKPGAEDCYQCAKVEAESCPTTFSIIVDYCIEDCNAVAIDRKFMVIRSVEQGVDSSPKQVGGNTPGNFTSNITISVNTNDGYGEGPADLIQSYDENGEPGCASVVCDVPCPTDGSVDFAELDALCDCASELAGTITADLIAANPELDHPFFTGV